MVKTAGQLTSEVNGSCHQAITAGINGNLPSGWMACGLRAQVILGQQTPDVAIFCSAYELGVAGWAPDQFRGGVKLEVTAAQVDSLKIADELATLLRERIAQHQAERKRKDRRVVVTLEAGAAFAPDQRYLCALNPLQIQPGRIAVIETGVSVEMTGVEALIRPLRELSALGLWVQPCDIDTDVKTGLLVVAANLGREAAIIKAGEPIARLSFVCTDSPMVVIAK